MNVLEIITAHLDANRFEGLCNTSLKCGCDPNDAPCDGYKQDCEPAHLYFCKNCKDEYYATELGCPYCEEEE